MKWTQEQRRDAERAARSGDMERADEILGTHGVEYVSVPWQSLHGRELAYCNVGDTYEETLCKEGDRVWWGSWGSWVEAAEEEYAQETGETHCPNCGEWGEWEKDEYGSSTCPFCGYVG
jgi:hypothetical protein